MRGAQSGAGRSRSRSPYAPEAALAPCFVAAFAAHAKLAARFADGAITVLRPVRDVDEDRQRAFRYQLPLDGGAAMPRATEAVSLRRVPEMSRGPQLRRTCSAPDDEDALRRVRH